MAINLTQRANNRQFTMQTPRILAPLVLSLSIAGWSSGQTTDQAATVGYEQAAAILNNYCAGCHGTDDPEGDFTVSSWQTLMAGTGDGPVVVAGNPQQSRLLQLLGGKIEPLMPPEDEPQPTPEEIALLSRWIEQGAQPAIEPKDAAGMQAGPDSQLDSEIRATAMALRLDAPQLPAAASQFHHVGAACSVTADTLALGWLGKVGLVASTTAEPMWITPGLSGKVNSLRLSPATQPNAPNWIVVGSGIAGVGGEALLLDPSNGSILHRFVGHSDAIYCAASSPDGRLLATGSYDRRILLWDIASKKILIELTGHNGAIYDLDFDPSGQLLATASADQTIKVWRVASGERLDTLGQPEGEQRAVRFSPDGQLLYAGGADKQIRQWQVVSREQPAINPLLIARYAHEADIVQLAFLSDGRLLSASTDRTVKLWSAEQIGSLGTVAQLSDVPVGLCVPKQSNASTTSTPVAVQLDAQRIALPLPEVSTPVPLVTAETTERNADATGSLASDPAPSIATAATEPPATTAYVEETIGSSSNNLPSGAALLALPAVVSGTIAAPRDGQADQDLFRFHATPDETWIIEVTAARSQSPLDSRIDILDLDGHPVLRTRLQATRQSYLTFRGKDSTTSDDFRMHRWEDMELDEYLYINGEVNRLWLYPRGPDSGFKVYPGAGNRYTFFDTTALAHPLGQNTYIVRELASDEEPLPNGLPVFPILVENDDDALARFGKDSRLTFKAPVAGDYLLRIRDARGFGGDDYAYQVTLRSPHPDFNLQISGTTMAMPVGSGREWSVAAQRIDGLDGPIAIALEGLPAGFIATNPLIIEANQEAALGCIFIPTSALEQLGDNKAFEATMTASATVGGQRITKPLAEKLVVTLSETDEVQVRLFAAKSTSNNTEDELQELTIVPGQTVAARVVVERNGTESRIELGNESSGRNLPHGAFVDNIGLNGLLIPEGETEREFVITAAPKVAPGRRQFHLRSATSGNPTSRPIWLNVQPANGHSLGAN